MAQDPDHVNGNTTSGNGRGLGDKKKLFEAAGNRIGMKRMAASGGTCTVTPAKRR